MIKLKQVFEEQFHKWGVEIPNEDLQQRRKGKISQNGWSISYHFGTEGKKEYMEFLSQHRSTNDTLKRIYEDGTIELIGYCQEFFEYGDSNAENEYLEHNRRFYERLKELGLM